MNLTTPEIIAISSALGLLAIFGIEVRNFWRQHARRRRLAEALQESGCLTAATPQPLNLEPGTLNHLARRGILKPASPAATELPSYDGNEVGIIGTTPPAGLPSQPGTLNLKHGTPNGRSPHHHDRNPL